MDTSLSLYHDPRNQLKGAVVFHGGLEQSAPADVSNLEGNLLLRVILKNDNGEFDLLFHGRWANVLSHGLEPGDLVTVDGASPPEAEERGWHVRATSTDAVLRLRRDSHEAVFDSASIDALDMPDWMKTPSWRPVRGVYQYINYMLNLRDGHVCNLFAVVFENAKPGPQQREGNATSNVLVVDRSFNHLPCTSWMCTVDLPQYSMQIAMASVVPESLPFLCVGDVIRCHRVRMSSRPPRFLNIRQQKQSSVIVFPTSLEHPGPSNAQDLLHQPVTRGSNTVLDSDRERAHLLHTWAREIFSRGTMSNWIVDACDMSRRNGNPNSSIDLIVKVIRVLPYEQVLVVSDGSISSPLHVQASEPPAAASWLFAHVKPDMWVKLRNVLSMRDYGNGCSLQVCAATVTRVPPWCYDVQRRAAMMASHAPPAAPASNITEAASHANLPEDERGADFVIPPASTEQSPSISAEGVQASCVPHTSSTCGANATATVQADERGVGIITPGGTTAQPSSASAADAQAHPPLRPGARVRLEGLQAAAFNGKTGVIQAFVPESQRWIVKLDDGAEKSFNGKNLVAEAQPELRPGARVRLEGLKSAAFNGKTGVVQLFVPNLQRWVVNLDDGEERSFDCKNLVVEAVTENADTLEDSSRDGYHVDEEGDVHDETNLKAVIENADTFEDTKDTNMDEDDWQVLAQSNAEVATKLEASATSNAESAVRASLQSGQTCEATVQTLSHISADSCGASLNRVTPEKFASVSLAGFFAAGKPVVLSGCKKRPELNGRVGILLHRKAGGKRWNVILEKDSQILAVKTANLRLAPRPISDVALSQDSSQLEQLVLQLYTTCGSGSAIRLSEVPAAIASGRKELILSNFQVAGVKGLSPNTDFPNMLRARCDMCGDAFTWDGGDENDAKRRRQTLPCGHWLFELVLELELELRDMDDPDQVLRVLVQDPHDKFFGISPQAASRDVQELQKINALVHALLTNGRGQDNTMAVKPSCTSPMSLMAFETCVALPA